MIAWVDTQSTATFNTPASETGTICDCSNTYAYKEEEPEPPPEEDDHPRLDCIPFVPVVRIPFGAHLTRRSNPRWPKGRWRSKT